jgi:hypothetical protein
MPADFDIAQTLRAAANAGASLVAAGLDERLLRLGEEIRVLMIAQYTCIDAIKGDECLPYLEAIDGRLHQLKGEILKCWPATSEGIKSLAKTTLSFQTSFLKNNQFDACDLDPDLVAASLRAVAA